MNKEEQMIQLYIKIGGTGDFRVIEAVKYLTSIGYNMSHSYKENIKQFFEEAIPV